MMLITKEIREQLLANGRAAAAAMLDDGNTPDVKPPLKLFYPAGAATWLISEMDPDQPDILFGLCDLGMGCPELGSVALSEIESLRGRGGVKIERDMYFKADKTIGEYADAARNAGRIEA